jgi:hypothetical protein
MHIICMVTFYFARFVRYNPQDIGHFWNHYLSRIQYTILESIDAKLKHEDRLISVFVWKHFLQVRGENM